jgi:ABC-2 type transport system permease protein
MRSYFHVFLTGIQSNLVYRWNVGMRAAFALIHLVFVVTLWTAAFQGRDEIGGFTLNQTLTYFLTIFYFNFLIVAWSEDYQIAEEIRNGTINQFLLKPIDYFTYRLSLFASARIVTGVIAVVPLLLASPLFGGYLEFPDDTWRWLLLPLALLLSAMLQFLIAYCYGMLAFWFLEIQGVVILSLAIETLLSGQLFPLDLIPGPLGDVVAYLPFAYLMYFPAALATGRIPELSGALVGIGVQVFWVFAIYGLARLMWRRGLLRHTAVGG